MRAHLAALALVLSGCAHGMGASVEEHTYPATREGALEAVKMAQAQGGEARRVLIQYRGELTKPRYFWQIAQGLARLDPQNPCRSGPDWCSDIGRIDDAYVFVFNGDPPLAQTPISITRVAPGANYFEAAGRAEAEHGKNFLLFVRYPAAGSVRDRNGLHIWRWADIIADKAIVQPTLLCAPYGMPAHTDCWSYEDIRTIEMVTLERGRDGRETRTHETFASTPEGATAALARLKLKDGKERHLRAEIPWQKFNSDSTGISYTLAGVTQLSDEQICGGVTRSLVDETCYRFASIDSFIVTDWRSTPGEVAKTLVMAPFRFIAGIPGP